MVAQVVLLVEQRVRNLGNLYDGRYPSAALTRIDDGR
jgi:hypothetical protein